MNLVSFKSAREGLNLYSLVKVPNTIKISYALAAALVVLMNHDRPDFTLEI